MTATIRQLVAPAQMPDPGGCPFCGGPAELGLEATDRNRELSDERFRYRRCLACGALSLMNVPHDLGRFYPSAYYELPSAADLDRVAPGEQHKVAMLGEHGALSGRLIEIGPGAGVFAYCARRAGFDVTAIEMDARVCAHLREAVGVEAIESDDPAAVLREQPRSRVIAMWHVIEHLPDPDAVLEVAATNLEPGGVLAVATPNPQSTQFKLMGAHWAHVDAPRHLILLPLDALTRRAEALGLRQVAVTTSDPSGRHWNRVGWEYGMRRRPAAGPAPKSVAWTALALTVALRPLEHSGLRGAAYTAIFVKADD